MAAVLVWAREEYGRSYGSIFAEEGISVAYTQDIADIIDVGMVLLIGGADVYPPLYKEFIGKHTRFTDGSSMEDIEILRSEGVINTAIMRGIPVVGICKGSQLLCVHQGGKLLQHVEQEGNHNVTTIGGETFFTKGGHHQVALPKEDSSIIIGYYSDSNGTNNHAEIVHYPDIFSWGVQYHPEYMDKESRGRRYFIEKCLRSIDGMSPFMDIPERIRAPQRRDRILRDLERAGIAANEQRGQRPRPGLRPEGIRRRPEFNDAVPRIDIEEEQEEELEDEE